MTSLNALAGAVRGDRERYVVAAARRFQTATGSSARYNALELLIMYVADALGSGDAAQLERWAYREVRDTPAATVVESLRAVSFALLTSAEPNRELFDAALSRLDHLERCVRDTVLRHERRAPVFAESSGRSGACEAILALAASLDPATALRRRAVARLAETLATELAFSHEAVHDVRDAALVCVLHDIDRFGLRIRAADVAAIAPLAALASLVALEADIEARTDLERLWSVHPDAAVLVAAADATGWPNDGLAGYLASERGLFLPDALRGALERAAGLESPAEPKMPLPAGGFSAHS